MRRIKITVYKVAKRTSRGPHIYRFRAYDRAAVGGTIFNYGWSITRPRRWDS